MIRLIIFDLDGPILDSLKRSKEGVMLGVKKLIQENKVPPEKVFLTSDDYIKYWGYPGIKTSELMFPLLTKMELGIIGDCWAENERSKKIPLVPGAIETLKYLKKIGLHAALLTSRSRNLQFHLKDYRLEDIFEIVQSWKSSAEQSEKIHRNHIFCSHHKPNPKVLNNIFERAKGLGILRKEMIMIDDTLVGLETAMRAKLKFLGVCTGPLDSKAKWLKYGNLEPKYVINSIADLPKWLKENAHVAQLVRAPDL